MPSAIGHEESGPTLGDLAAVLGWSALAATFAVLIDCESLSREASGGTGGGDRPLVRLAAAT